MVCPDQQAEKAHVVCEETWDWTEEKDQLDHREASHGADQDPRAKKAQWVPVDQRETRGPLVPADSPGRTANQV